MTTALPPIPHRGPISFRLDGERYDLPTIPTEAWLDAFGYAMPAAWMFLLPGYLPDSQQERLNWRLTDPSDPFDIDHLEKNALTVLAAPLGVDFHVAQRLIAAARTHWMLFDARLASYGLDPMTTHISRLVNIAYSLRLEACEKDSERAAAKALIFAPPDGTRASGKSWDDDPDFTATIDQIESDAFMAMFH